MKLIWVKIHLASGMGEFEGGKSKNVMPFSESALGGALFSPQRFWFSQRIFARTRR